jgi:hypothetical protein
MKWNEERPYLWKTNTSMPVTVWRDLLGNDTEQIWMSVDKLGIHRIKLDAKNFKEAKSFAINYIKLTLQHMLDEYNDVEVSEK